MFFHSFSMKQKLAFLGLADRLVAADERIDRAETSYLVLIKLEMGLDPDTPVPAGQSLDGVLSAFDSKASRCYALLELIGLADIDNELARREQAFIDEVASGLRVPGVTLAKMIDWVKRHKAMLGEANALAQTIA